MVIVGLFATLREVRSSSLFRGRFNCVCRSSCDNGWGYIENSVSKFYRLEFSNENLPGGRGGTFRCAWSLAVFEICGSETCRLASILNRGLILFDSKGDVCGSIPVLANLCAWEGSKDRRNGEDDCSDRRGWVVCTVTAPSSSLDWGNAVSRVLYLRRRLASLDLVGRSRLHGIMEIQEKNHQPKPNENL